MLYSTRCCSVCVCMWHVWIVNLCCSASQMSTDWMSRYLWHGFRYPGENVCGDEEGWRLYKDNTVLVRNYASYFSQMKKFATKWSDDLQSTASTQSPYRWVSQSDTTVCIYPSIYVCIYFCKSEINNCNTHRADFFYDYYYFSDLVWILNTENTLNIFVHITFTQDIKLIKSYSERARFILHCFISFTSSCL